MRIRVQNSHNSAVTNSVRTYEGYAEALLLLTSEDKEISNALERVFAIHGAPLVNPEETLPWDEPDVGDCRIDNESALFTLEGSGGTFMGMRHEVRWGRTSPEWHAHAERRGRVWLGLVEPADYIRISEGGWTEQLPLMRMLKLEVTP